MKRIRIFVIQPVGSLDELKFPKEYGSAISDESSIKVNRVRSEDGDYSVIFRDTLFDRIDPTLIGSTIKKTIVNNLPDEEFEYKVNFYKAISDTTRSNIRKMMSSFGTAEPKTIQEQLTSIRSDEDWEDDDDEDYYDDDDDIEYDDDEDDDDEDVDYDDDISGDMLGYLPLNVGPRFYHSMSWHNASDARKMVRRHGVLVASKKDIKKDERIIREFLKEFFPGNAGWKKEFRADVAKRWVQMFVVTKGQLKRLEKATRKARREKYKSDSNDRAMEFTRMLFGGRDHWSDPNR